MCGHRLGAVGLVGAVGVVEVVDWVHLVDGVDALGDARPVARHVLFLAISAWLWCALR